MSDSENDKPRHPKRKPVPPAMRREDDKEPRPSYHHDVDLVIVAVAGTVAVTAICVTAIVIFRTALADIPANRRVEIIDALANFARTVRSG